MQSCLNLIIALGILKKIDLGERIVCLGEGSWGKGAEVGERGKGSGRKGEGKWGKREESGECLTP